MASECEAAAPLGGGGGRSRRNGLASAAAAVVLALSALLGVNAAVANSGVTFVVDDTRDMVDGSTDDGVCRSAAGMCTLRAAIQQANASPGADTILVPSGTYALAIPPQGENGITTGDLDITDSLTISGAGAGATIVDGGTPPAGSPPQVRGLDRLFEVLVPGGSVAFSGLTVSDGYAAEYGGAILNSSSATVTITGSALTGSTAGKTGGAIDNHVGGTVRLQNSTVSSNYAVEGGSAINNNLDGVLELTSSTVSHNSAAVAGLDETLMGAGAISNNAEHDATGTIIVTGSQIFENESGGGRSGAGISNDGAGTLVVDQTTFSKNSSSGDGGAIFNGTGDVRVTDSTFVENAGKDGGAIASKGGVVTVLDSSFSKNRAADWGGGVSNGNLGGATIRNSSFTENTALNGGGVANEGTGLVTVENSTFMKNSAIEPAALAGGEGGGMHSNSGGVVVLTGGSFTENKAHAGGGFSNEGGGTVTITGTRFSGNLAEEQGGGILVQGGDVHMLEIDVVGNISESLEEGGGGISYAGDKAVSVGESAAIENSRIRDNKSNGEGGGVDSRGDGPLLITTSAITGNTAAIGGAIHHVGDATLAVTRSTLSGNFAEHGGGVLTDGDGEATVENTTVSGNRAGKFGGGLLVSSRLIVRNSTVTNNLAASGGGIDNGGGDLVGDGLVYLANSIVANNPAGGNCAGAISSRGGNVENSDSCQLTLLSDQPGTDPLLGPLADNGGPTQTHALLADSPAQDKAVCTEVDPCLSLDQRGVERPKVSGFDAGAYESELAPGGGTPECAGRTERPVFADFDSWVSQSSAEANFGSDGILKVESQSGSNERALVHFTLPSVPPGCELVGATLRLYAAAATDGRTLQALRLASDWSETAVTWNNQPAAVGPAATTDSGLGFREWDVLPQTLEMYTFGSHGFVVRDGAGNGSGAQSFHSREKGVDRPPELVLVFDDPDAPPKTGDCPTVPQLVSADRDAWVSQGSPSNNFGTDSTLKVKSHGGSNSRALVRFLLPSLPAGCTTVSSAILRLHASSAKEGRTLQVVQAASSWSETGITWSNQPATTGPPATTPSGQGPLEWDVTSQTLGIYVEGNHGFLIQDAVEDGIGDEQALNSRENGSAPPELEFVFDDSTPETTIHSGPVSPIAETDAVFTFSSDRDDATFECSLDGTAFRACTSPHMIEGLPEGDHRLEVRATRRIRAVDPTPASYGWTVDLTAPVATVESGPADPTRESGAEIAFSGSDNVDAVAELRFQCRFDEDPAFGECSSPKRYDVLAPGRHAFEVRAVDRAGNVGAAASYAWTIDLTAPETAIQERPPDPSNERSPGFGLGGSDNVDEPAQLRFQCRLDSTLEEAWEACSSPKEYAALAEGGHSFELRAIDRAGNVDESPDSYAWRVDLTAPEATVLSGPADPTNDTSASLAFTGSDNQEALGELSFQCRLDHPAADYGPCTSPQAYELLSEGAHTFEVRATDRGGNVGEAASYSWNVDVTDPVAEIGERPPDPSKESTATLTFTGSDNVDEVGQLRFQCRLDHPAADYGDCQSPQNYELLAEGAHTLEVRALDRAGNVGAAASYSWTVDQTAPESAIGARPADPTNATTASFALTGSDNHSAAGALSFQCRLDEEAVFADCSSPKSYELLAPGRHTFQVRALDRAGNVESTPASYSWTIDVTAPESTIAGAPADPSNSSSASLAFSGSDNLDDPSQLRFQCRLDAEAVFAACSSPKNYELLAEGAHTFEVRALDRAGNVESTPASYSWTIDVAEPDSAVTDGPADPTNETSASISFSGSDSLDSSAQLSFQCRLDGTEATAWSACTSPKSYSALAEGRHTFEVRGLDRAGNVESTPASYAWTIDLTEPETVLGDAPPATTTSTSATFTFSSDAGTTFECKLDMDAFTDCHSPKSYTDLAVGGHRFEVRARDAGGNRDSSPATYDWTVEAPDTTPPDTNPPETTIASGPADPTNQTAANFSFAGTDDVSEPSSLRFECRLDTTAEAGWEVCSSPKSYSALADRTHTFEVRAIDVAGNVDSSPATDSWTIETSAPETTIDSGPSGLTNDSTPTYAFSSEAGARFQCRVDGGSYTACTSPHTTAPLADGAHTFEVRALDAAGNADASPASRAVTVDSAAPQTSIGDAPPATTSSTTATFTFSSESAATFECSLDATPFAACTSPRQYTGLASGGHQFRVRATDAAGNTDASPATHSWTIDTTAPETTIGDKPPATTTSTSATLTFSSSEAGSTFECSLDGAAFAACTSPKDYTGLAVGTHEFRVRAKDAAGNTDASPATYSWTIEAAGTCAGPSTVTAAANADTWVLESSSTSNYGSDSVAKVDTKAGANARALFRFTLPALPSGCRVTDAKLRLYASSYKSGRTLEAVRLGANWTESGVRWSNQPATTGAAATASSPSASTYVQWSVTSQVESMYSGDSHGFLIRDSVENGSGIEQGFHSREKGTDNPPQLVISFG